VEHLHQLNNKFWAWLEQEYQQNSHSVTNETPNLRWRQQITPFLRKIEEKQLQAIFLWRENRKVNKLGQVSLQGLSFEVDSFLVGKTVEIRYNHFDLAQVLIYLNGQFIQKATQASLKRWNTASKLPRSGEQKTAKPVASGIKHLTHLEKQHKQQKIQQAKNLLGQTNQGSVQQNNQGKKTKQPFTSAHFVKHVATALNRKVEHFHANELQALQNAWNDYGPFHASFIHTALAKAIIAKGYHQHIDFYLNYIVQSHLKHRNHNQQENQHE
jgi:hypothetical protein